MTTPRDPHRDLRLERLGSRDGQQGGHLGEIGHVSQAETTQTGPARNAYQALIDAVFLAPGVGEWLAGLKMAVATILAGKDHADRAPRLSVPPDAIRPADPRHG
jgi:hypothetical protein